MARKQRRRTFGHVRQLPSGRWQARYRVGPDYTDETSGTVKSRYQNAPHTFATKLDAEAWLAAERAGAPRRVESGKPEVPVRVMFADYSASWIANGGRNPHKGLRPRTVEHYGQLRERLLLPWFGALALDEVTPGLVRQWFAEVGERTGPTMRSHAYTLLSGIMATAVDDELIVSSPCRLRGASAQAHTRDMTVLTPAELVKLANAAPERYRLFVMLAAWCALRQGELVELRRKDVDVDAGTIRVERAVSRVGGTQQVGPPKSAAGRRTVSIPPHLMPMVAEHLEQHTQPGPEGLLFASTSGKQPQPSSIYKWFDKARDEVGKPDLRLHDLRHCGATLAAQSGATLAELMRRLGHSTPRAALLYQHAADERDRELAARLSALAEVG